VLADAWSCGGGGPIVWQWPGAAVAGVGLTNRAPHAVVWYGEEVGGAWAGVGVMGQPGKKINGSGLKKNSNFFYLFKKVLKELNGFDQKRFVPILKNFK
jgi:hypothetical protein